MEWWPRSGQCPLSPARQGDSSQLPGIQDSTTLSYHRDDVQPFLQLCIWFQWQYNFCNLLPYLSIHLNIQMHSSCIARMYQFREIEKLWSLDNLTSMVFPHHLYQYWGRAVVSDDAHVSVSHTGAAGSAGDHDQCRGHRPAPVHGPPLPEARAAPWQPPGCCKVPPAHTWWVS